MSTVIETNIYKLVESSMDKDKCTRLNRYIQQYIDKNSEILAHNVPSYRLFFYPKDEQFVFSLLGIDPKFITDSMSKIKEVSGTWKLINKPFNIIMLCLIKYFELTKNNQSRELSLLYLTLYLYSSLHFKYFRNFLPNEDCLQYTFNRISDKYFFRQYGQVSKALYATAAKNHETFKKDLIGSDDLKFLNYFVSLRTRLNNQMKSFTNEYMKDFESGNYLHYSQDSRDEENYYETNNISGQVMVITNKACNKFLSSSLDMRVLRNAAGISKVELTTLKIALESIKDTENEKVRLLVLSIIQCYLSNPKNTVDSIGSQKFFTYSLSLYTKSNVKDESIINIKRILDDFLTNHCDKYSGTEREATRSSYRKAVYIYFVLLINNTQTTYLIS